MIGICALHPSTASSLRWCRCVRRTHREAAQTQVISDPAVALAKIVIGHLNSQIDDLLPWAYVKAEPLKAVG
jgi:hypothetical protein